MSEVEDDDAVTATPGCVRREHGDDRADPPAIGGLAQMGDAFGRDLIGGADRAPVPDPQRAPVQPPDAA
jgi:hypothetical protein